MIKITNNLLVEGVGAEVKSYDITEDGPREKTWTYEAREPLMTFGITGDIWGAVFSEHQVAGGIEYTTTGRVAPVGLDIHLSLLAAGEDTTPE